MKPDIWHDPLFLAGLKGGGQGGSASGPIVTFTGDGSPLRSLRLAIDPVQDLHGYEYPWPAGGGKNLVNYLACVGVGVRDDSDSVNASVTVSSDVITMTGYASYQSGGQIFKGIGSPSITGAFTVSADVKCTTSSVAFGVGAYEGGGTSDVAANYSVTANTWTHISRTFTHKTYSKIGIFLQPKLGTDTLEVKNLQLELGSSATAFAPYSNLCPISGWDEANLWRTGKNLLPNTPGRDSSGTLTYSVDPTTKKLVINGTASSTSYTGGGITKANARYKLKAGTYMLSVDQFPTNTAASYLNFEMFTSDGVRTQKVIYGNSATKYVKFTITSDVVCDWWMAIAVGTYDNLQCGIQLELSSTPTPYTPYTGTSYPITIPTPPGTVYGGYISVSEDGSAELVVDREEVDLGTLEWSSWGTVEGLYGAEISDMKAPTTAEERKTDILCSMYPVAASATMNNNFTDKSCARYQQNVFVRDTSYATAAALTTALDGVSFVYPLATPLHYPLSDITVQTLAGTNVMWADCGDIAVEWAGGKGFGKEAMLAWVMNR